MKYVIAIAAAMSLATACAPAPIVSTTQSITPETVRVAQQSVAVYVQNDAAVPATIYLLDRGQKTRLGEVSASSNGRFVIRNFGNEIAFYVTTSWDQAGSSNTIDALAGTGLLLKVNPTLSSIIALRK